MRDRLFRMAVYLDPRKLGPRVQSWAFRNVPGMLTCREFEDFVYDYYEGDLDPRQRAVFERHMRLCPMCRVHFDSYLRAVALGRQICEDDETLPQDMPEELIQAIVAARDRD